MCAWEMPAHAQTHSFTPIRTHIGNVLEGDVKSIVFFLKFSADIVWDRDSQTSTICKWNGSKHSICTCQLSKSYPSRSHFFVFSFCFGFGFFITIHCVLVRIFIFMCYAFKRFCMRHNKHRVVCSRLSIKPNDKSFSRVRARRTTAPGRV